jgi:hypothetical protein
MLLNAVGKKKYNPFFLVATAVGHDKQFIFSRITDIV